MNHEFLFLLLVAAEIDGFAFVIVNMDRPLDQHVKIVVYHVQI